MFNKFVQKKGCAHCLAARIIPGVPQRLKKTPTPIIIRVRTKAVVLCERTPFYNLSAF